MGNKNDIKKPTGIILAGGKSSRMGSEKALLIIKGYSLIETAVKNLEPLCSTIIISSDKDFISAQNVKTISDEIPDIGPMGGIYSCLNHSETEQNIIISIDTPFLNSDLLQYLVQYSNDHIVCIPEHKNTLHPLVGVYKKNFIRTLKQEIAAGHYKMLTAIKKTNHRIINISESLSFYNEHLFFNINTPEDFTKAKK